MKAYAYYHIYLTEDSGNWSRIFLDQMKTVEDSGLMDRIDAIYVTCIGSNMQVRYLHGLCSLYPKIQIIQVFDTVFQNDASLLSLEHRNDAIDETYTLKQLWLHAQREDAYFLYFHPKGVTSSTRFLQQGNFSEYRNYLYWRKFLEWGCIENWELCLRVLSKRRFPFDTAGVNSCEWPVLHYSGGFWWTKGSYASTLPNPNEYDWWDDMRSKTPDLAALSYRLRPEMWVGQKSTLDRTFSLYNAPNMPPISNLARENISRSTYTK